LPCTQGLKSWFAIVNLMLRTKIVNGAVLLSLIIAITLSIPFGLMVFFELTRKGLGMNWLMHSIISPPPWSACIDCMETARNSCYVRCSYPSVVRISVYSLWASFFFWITFALSFTKAKEFRQNLGRQIKESVRFRLVMYLLIGMLLITGIVGAFFYVYALQPV
jgi:hypothetical protein